MGSARRGRKRLSDEVGKYLAEQGLVAVPTPAEEAGPEAPGVAGLPSFDEETTRTTVGLLVDAYGEFKADAVKEAAEKALEPSDAAAFAERGKLGEGRRRAFTDAGVEVARRYGVGVSPEIILVALAVNELREFRSMRAELARLAKLRADAMEPPGA